MNVCWCLIFLGMVQQITSESGPVSERYALKSTNGVCSNSGMINSLDECKSGIKYLKTYGGVDIVFRKTESEATYPKGCYKYEEYPGTRIYWNTHMSGHANRNARPICKEGTPTDAGYSITSRGVSCADKGMTGLNDEAECESAVPKIQNLIPDSKYNWALTTDRRSPGCHYLHGYSRSFYWNNDKNGKACSSCQSVCKGEIKNKTRSDNFAQSSVCEDKKTWCRRNLNCSHETIKINCPRSCNAC